MNQFFSTWLSGNGVFTTSFTVLIRLLHSQVLILDSSILSKSQNI